MASPKNTPPSKKNIGPNTQNQAQQNLSASASTSIRGGSSGEGFWKKHFLPALAIFVLAVLLYGYSCSFKYALDDQIYITGNQFTKQGLLGIPDLLAKESFVGFWGEKKDLLEGGRYRPLTIVTFAIEYQFFGETPAVSHFINVILYGLLGLLLYRVLCRIFPPKEDSTRWYSSLAFIATALYVAHPLHVEWVANIKGRMEMMTIVGVLLTLNYVLRYMEGRQNKDIFMAGFMFFLAMMTKENAITFLAVVPLTLYFFARPQKIDYITTSAPLWVAVALYFVIRFQAVGFFLGGNSVIVTELLNDPFLGASKADKFATVFYTMGLYIKLLFFPSMLTHDYYPKQIPIISWADPRAIVSLILYVAMGLYALWGLPKKRIDSYGILFYLLTFSIVSNLVFSIGSFMNDRFMDLPSIGFCIVVAYWLVEKIPAYLGKEALTRYATPAFFIILALFSLRTMARVPDWYDNESLFLTDVNISTNSTKVNTSAGGTLIEKAARLDVSAPQRNVLFEQGVKYLTKALEIYPNNTNALLLIGNAYHDWKHDYDSALKYYGQLLKVAPQNAQLVKNLSIISETVERPEDAVKLVNFYEREVLPVDSMNATHYDALGVLYGKKLNNLDKSIAYFEKSLALNPKNVGSMQDMGIAYGMKGNFAKSLELNQQVLTIEPNNAKAMLNIAITYQNLGDKEKAERYFQKAFTLDPSLKK